MSAESIFIGRVTTVATLIRVVEGRIYPTYRKLYFVTPKECADRFPQTVEISYGYLERIPDVHQARADVTLWYKLYNLNTL